ncbi:MAG: efflux RND transporter periplasmic adaptor subunit [bacterium]
MPKIFKSKLFWLIIVILLIVGGGFYYKNNKQKPSDYTTEKVQRGKLVQTISATGMVEPAKDISLNFALGGRLNYLPIKEGQSVKAGQVLARINSGSLAAQVEQYRANLLVAQADLDKVRTGSSNEDVNVSEEKFNKAKNDLKSLETESAAQLQILREKNLDAINDADFAIKVALDKVYHHLINPDTTLGLLFSNSQLDNQVNDEYTVVATDVIKAQAAVQSANENKTTDNLVIVSEDLRQFLIELNDFLLNAYNLSKVIIVNSSYSQTNKDTIKSDLDTQQASINTALTALQTAKANLINNTNSYTTQLQAARDNLAVSQAELNLKKSGPRDFEIKSAQAKVAQAQAQLNKVLADLGDYQIIAPIDGIITKINYSLGEQTSLSEPIIKMLSVGLFEIKVDIPESDIAKLKLGNRAVIELDAFGSDQIFKGSVAFIDPAQTIIQDVTYYKTTVSFDKDSWNDNIKSGMTADVTVVTAEQDNVLYIPQRAAKIKETVLGETAVKFVEVLVNQQAQEKIVETGLRGDNGLVEITNGLTEGEEVVVFKKNGK